MITLIIHLRYVVIPLAIILYVYWTYKVVRYLRKQLFTFDDAGTDPGSVVWVTLHGGLIIAGIFYVISEYW